MKTIFLWVNGEGWKSFDFDAEETKKALSDRHITIGYGAEIGYGAKIGDGAEIGDGAAIGYGAKIGYGAEIGDYAEIGDGAAIGYGAKIGYGAEIGDYAKIGDGAKIGDYAKIGYGAEIGDYAEIGDSAKIGDKEVILKTIFIAGTKHTVTWYGTNEINIGCHKKSISWWLKNGKDIAEREGYSEEQTEEYRQYVLICKKLQALK